MAGFRQGLCGWKSSPRARAAGLLITMLSLLDAPGLYLIVSVTGLARRTDVSQVKDRVTGAAFTLPCGTEPYSISLVPS